MICFWGFLANEKFGLMASRGGVGGDGEMAVDLKKLKSFNALKF
jgi:hypothetical protein